MNSSMTNQDVSKLMLAAAERVNVDDFDAAIVHLKSAIGVLGLLKKRSKERLPGVAGDVAAALVNLDVDRSRAREVVEEVVRSEVKGFENIFRVALTMVSGSQKKVKEAA